MPYKRKPTVKTLATIPLLPIAVRLLRLLPFLPARASPPLPSSASPQLAPPPIPSPPALPSRSDKLLSGLLSILPTTTAVALTTTAAAPPRPMSSSSAPWSLPTSGLSSLHLWPLRREAANPCLPATPPVHAHLLAGHRRQDPRRTYSSTPWSRLTRRKEAPYGGTCIGGGKNTYRN